MPPSVISHKNGPGAGATARRAYETTYQEIPLIDDTKPTPSEGTDVRCADCGKHLPGWSYKPMFVQCDDCAAAELAAQRNAKAAIAAAHIANRAELAEVAEGNAVGVYARIAVAVDRCGLSVPQLAGESGLGLGHLSAVLDGDGELTVTELLLLAGALSADAAAWFATAEQETTR